MSDIPQASKCKQVGQTIDSTKMVASSVRRRQREATPLKTDPLIHKQALLKIKGQSENCS